MTGDPFKQSTREKRDVKDSRGLEVAKVVSIEREAHMVEVEPVTYVGESGTRGTPIISSVTVAVKGDASLPAIGDLVLVSRFRSGVGIIVGTYYTDSKEIPTTEDGERVISHADSDSQIRLKPSGDVEIQPEGDVIINGGGTKVVTDVTTTKDVDGHVTDISITRAEKTEVKSQ